MNKMLNQLRIDGDGKEKGIEDFDDLDDEDSDDEGTGWNKVRRVSKIYKIRPLDLPTRSSIFSFWGALDFHL